MQQLTLFSEHTPVLPITYYPDFLSLEQTNSLYQHCLQLEWQQNQIRMLGKTMPVPRLECIYGDYGCDYLYSKCVFLKPLWWTEALSSLRDRITALTGYKFRIVKRSLDNALSKGSILSWFIVIKTNLLIIK